MVKVGRWSKSAHCGFKGAVDKDALYQVNCIVLPLNHYFLI